MSFKKYRKLVKLIYFGHKIDFHTVLRKINSLCFILKLERDEIYGFKRERAMVFVFHTKPMQKHFDSENSLGGSVPLI